MRGLYLKDGSEIVTGKKTAIACVSSRLDPGKMLLIVKQDDGSYIVPGSILLEESKEVTLDEFDKESARHCVTKVQRRKWWPEAESLTVHPLTYSAFPEKQAVDIAPGSTMQVELVGLGLKEIATEDRWYIYEVD